MAQVRPEKIESAGSEAPPVQESRDYSLPEKSRSEWGIALGVFAVACLYLWLFRDYTTFDADEGITLQGATRILAGQIPYRDLSTFVTPGTYYWTALLFRVFGNSMLVARAALVVYGGIFSVFTYLVARRVCSRWVALFTVYLMVVVCLPYRFIASHNWDSTLWACLCLYAALRFLESPHAGWAFAAGTLASLTCLFEQSKGAGLLFGLALGFAAIRLAEGRNCGFTWRHLAWFTGGLAWPAVVTAAYFAAHHSFSQMTKDLLWPLSHYSSVEKLPYGWPEWTDARIQIILHEPWPSRLAILFIFTPHLVVDTLPIIALGFLGTWFLRLRNGKNSPQAGPYFVLVAATIAGLLLVTFKTRPDLTHILFLAPIFILVLAWLLAGASAGAPFMEKARPFMMLYLFLSFSALGLSQLFRPLNARAVLHTRRGDLRASKFDPTFAELERYLHPGQTTFVYPYQPLYYYWTDTFSATRDDWLQPGLHTPEQFQEAREDLEVSRPSVVLFCPSFPEWAYVFFPSTPLEALSRKNEVEDFILAHYKPCTALPSAVIASPLVIMVRKDLDCARSD